MYHVYGSRHSWLTSMLKLLVCFVDCEAKKEDTDWKCVHQNPLCLWCLLVDCRDSGCQRVVLSSSDSSHRGTRPPPAGAICISDKAIHHPHCSARFSFFFLIHQTAWGGAEQLHMYILVMRALETCLVALQPASRAEGNQWVNPLGWTRTHPPGFFPKHGIHQYTPHCGEDSTKLRRETGCCSFFGLRFTIGMPPPLLHSASCFSYQVWGK